MANEGILLQVTHTGTPNTSLLLSDVDNGLMDNGLIVRRPGPVYVPVGQTVTLVYTGDVALSFESGTIRQFMTLGYLTASFYLGPAFDAALTNNGSGAFRVVTTVAARNAIPAAERIEYLVAYVAETGILYQLVGGTANVNWEAYDYGRPQDNVNPSQTDFYVDSTTGSDIDGTGTLASPYKTITRVLQDIGVNNYSVISGVPSKRININGTVALPGNFNNVNSVEVRSTSVTSTLTATIANVVSASSSGGIILDVTGPVGATLNSLKGTPILWTSGPANTARGWIYRNDATDTYVAGQTRIYVSQNGTNSVSVPVVGNTLDFRAYSGTIQGLLASPGITNCFGTSFTDVNFVGEGLLTTLVCSTTAQVSFNNCKVSAMRGLNAGFSGRLVFLNCYIITQPFEGLFTAYNNAQANVGRGTVFDGTLAGVQNFIGVSVDSDLAYTGQTVFTGISGIRIDGSNVTPSGTMNAHVSFYFDNATNGVVINTNGRERGGVGFLPNLYGTVSSNYAVVASGGANFRLGPNSSITSALGVNFVSADGGTTNVAEASDGTYIQGGSPSVGFLWTTVTYTNAWVTSGAVAVAYARDESEGVVYLRGSMSTGAIGTSPFTLPARFRPSVGPRFYAVPSGTGPYTMAVIQIDTTGVVTVLAGDNARVSLDGVVFEV